VHHLDVLHVGDLDVEVLHGSLQENWHELTTTILIELPPRSKNLTLHLVDSSMTAMGGLAYLGSTSDPSFFQQHRYHHLEQVEQEVEEVLEVVLVHLVPDNHMAVEKDLEELEETEGSLNSFPKYPSD